LEGKDKDDLIQDLENVLNKNLDKDWKILLESKEDMKKRIWRSPDIADSIMMRMVYELEGTWEIRTYKAFFDEY
jgi:predicted nucleic acid-binding OB-fold protein